MAAITFRGTPVNTNADFIAAGAELPSVKVLTPALETIEAADAGSGTVILNIFPSVDTGVCTKSVETFTERGKADNLTVINVSVDTPFAQQRFADDNAIEGALFGSFIRDRSGMEHLGVLMTDGPLEGFAARSVVVVGADGKVAYSELVPEIAHEPNYDAALEAAKA